jgi:hypothetical protein
MNAGKVAREFGWNVRRAFFDADFFRKTRRIKSATFKDEIDEAMKGASPELRQRLVAVKAQVMTAEIISEGDAGRRDCLEWGLAAGIALTIAIAEMTKNTDGGSKAVVVKGGKKAWDLLRERWRLRPRSSTRAIYDIVSQAYYDKHGIQFPLKRSYVEKQFHRLVRNRI